MTELDDIELLRRFAVENSEAAFAAIVGRHVNLVYSVALRQVGNPHSAEEITQAVFIILARKAKTFSRKTILTGWLHQTTRLTAANYLRTEIRRQRREQEAFMQSILTETETWTQIAPLLDDAITRLGEHGRNAILLRYFENKSAGEMAAALRIDSSAAQKRVTRAVEKLRKFFAKRGVTLTAAAIAGAVSANSVQAAPVSLSISTVAAIKGSAVSVSTMTLVKGTLKIMTYAKLKLAVGICAAILLAAGAATVVLSSDGTDDNLQAGEIFKKAQDTYAALTSYSDEGETVVTLNGSTITTTFKIKLARPNFYRIEWEQNTEPSFGSTTTITNTIWSAGEGDFMLSQFEILNKGGRATKFKDKETALAGATGISGNTAATIPGTFFKMNWGNQLGDSAAGEKQQPDEKVGGLDCYVFTDEVKTGQTKTLWIGKQDFLIHQVRTVMSADAMKATMAKAAKGHPDITARLQQSGFTPTEYVRTEIHTNIVVNPNLSAADFTH